MSGGLWRTAGNWSPVGGPPDVEDTANFNFANSYTVQLAGGVAHEADVVAIRGGVVTLESDSTSLPGALNVTSPISGFYVIGGSAIIGSAGRPVTLTVADNFVTGNIASTTVTANSDVISEDLFLGTSTSSDALLRVTGAGSTVTITESSAVIAGSGGKGSMVVENGATATFSGPVFTEIAVSVNGQDTRGTVEVLTGGILTARHLQVGAGPGGKLATLLVKDSNSTVTQTGDSSLTVGNSSNNNIIADVTVADSAVFNSGKGAITFNNTGTLNVVRSGTLNANGSLALNGGTAMINGGTLNSNGPLSIDGGTVSLVAGALNAGAIGLVNGGTFKFDGGTLHVDNFNGDLVNQAGKLAPGHSAGLTTISGGYTQQMNGVLEIEIGGLLAGSQFDMLDVRGSANLGGTLQVSLINGFTPMAGASFNILDWGARNGTFQTLNLPALAGGGRWDASQLYVTGALSVLPHFEADFDEDRDVDGEDLVNWKSGFGASTGATHLQGDANGDHDVDGGDFLVWQQQRGGVPTTTAADAAVPEPSALCLMLSVVLSGAAARAGRGGFNAGPSPAPGSTAAPQAD